MKIRFVCLKDKHNRIFKCKDNELKLMEVSELEEFIYHISLIDNFKYYAILSLKSPNEKTRKAASLNYQARDVLQTINESFTIESMARWGKHLRKSKL